VEETAEALLNAIKEEAPNANASQLRDLAYAYALIAAAEYGNLPGAPVITEEVITEE
jgi:hypothetical protein